MERFYFVTNNWRCKPRALLPVGVFPDQNRIHACYTSTVKVAESRLMVR